MLSSIAASSQPSSPRREAPGSQETLLSPSPLRTGRESFDLIRLKPLKRPFQDAVSQRSIFGYEPGYEVARTLEIWKAGDFPADVILRPDHEYQEAEIEPDEGPLVEQYENASRLGDDGWLEAAFEDSLSSWDE